MNNVLTESRVKVILRAAYRGMNGICSLIGLVAPTKSQRICLYYGGARKGSIGGSLVKIKRLNDTFPEDRWRYNIVYLLSNTPYLPYFALRILKKKKVPIVYNQNGVFYPAWYGGDYRSQNKRMALSYHISDYVFYQSEFCRRCADLFLGERRGESEILYNAVDTEFFVPAEHEVKNKKPFCFLITGKIFRHQTYRIESTIHGLSYARLQGLDCCLHIAGYVDDSVKREMESLASQLEIKPFIQFLGPYSQEFAPNIYQAADAYVMTNYNDACPNSVLEALSCGLPVIYSRSGGVPELVGEDAGIGLECQEGWDKPRVPESEAIGEGMIELAERWEQYKVAARERAVNCFDIKYWLQRHREIFTKLLNLHLNFHI